MNSNPGGDAPRRRQAGPRRRVATASGATRGYKRPRPPRSSHGPVDSGFSPMTVLLLIVAIGLAVIMGMVLKPKNLKSIQGYPAELLLATDSRNLLGELQAALNPELNDQTVTFTEAEVNQYLNQRIKGKQTGILSALVKYRGIYVDFEPGYAEIFVVRSVVGIPFTVSCRVTQKKSDYKSIWKAGGGTIGSFTMKSKQFKPILEAFLRLSATCKDEMDAMNSMLSIDFGDDQIAFKK